MECPFPFFQIEKRECEQRADMEKNVQFIITLTILDLIIFWHTETVKPVIIETLIRTEQIGHELAHLQWENFWLLFTFEKKFS